MLTLAAQEADIVGINVRLDSGTLGPERGVSATFEATREIVTDLSEIPDIQWNRLAAAEKRRRGAEKDHSIDPVGNDQAGLQRDAPPQ